MSSPPTLVPGLLVAGGSIDFYEFATAAEGGPSPKFSASRERRGATRIGYIDWQEIDAAMLELFPDPPALPGIYPGVSYLFADQVTEISPWPASPLEGEVTCPAGVNQYDKAKLVIQYATLPYDESDLISRSRTYSVQSMPVPENGVFWEDGSRINIPDLVAFKNIPVIEHKITLYRSDASSDSDVRDLIGLCNDGAFEGAADETLLFNGIDESFTISTSGVKSYTKTFSFTERRVRDGANVYGWNHAWRQNAAGGGEWQRLKTKNGDPFIPKTANFGNLF